MELVILTFPWPISGSFGWFLWIPGNRWRPFLGPVPPYFHRHLLYRYCQINPIAVWYSPQHRITYIALRSCLLKSVKKELAILSVPLLALFVFVKWIRISVWCHSLSAWRTCFSSFRKTGRLGSNDLHGCWSENVFISPSFWKSSFAR